MFHHQPPRATRSMLSGVLIAVALGLSILGAMTPAFGHPGYDLGSYDGDCSWDASLAYNVFGVSVRGVTADWYPKPGCTQVQAKVMWLQGSTWRIDDDVRDTPGAAVWLSYGDHVAYNDANVLYDGVWWGFRVNHT